MAEKLERKFLKPTQISKHLYCSICTEVFYEPMRLFCGHTFCHKCITEWETKNKTCPICRKPIEIGLMGKDLISDKIIQDFDVYCVNKLCEWKGKLEDLPKHVKSCAFAKAPAWLDKAQSSIQLDNAFGAGDLYMQANEEYMERVNEEVSRKSLLERLYTKSEESKELISSNVPRLLRMILIKIKGVFNEKKKSNRKGKSKKVQKASTFEDYENFFGTLGDSDEEVKEGIRNKAKNILYSEGLEKSAEKSDFDSNKEPLSKPEDKTGNLLFSSNEGLEPESTKTSNGRSEGVLSADKDKEKEEGLEPESEIVVNENKPQTRRTTRRTANRVHPSDPGVIKKSKTAAS